MASLVSSSLKTGQVGFSYGLLVLKGDDSHGVDALILPTSQTLMTLMMKLTLLSYHSQIHGLMKVKVTGVEPPITPCCLWPQFWPHCGTQPHSCCPAQAPTGASPIIWQSPGGWLIGGTVLVMKTEWCQHR